MVDALGNLVDFVLLAGQRHDLVGADPLLAGVEFGALIADRAYDSNALRSELEKRGATAVIPPDRIASRSLNTTWRCTSGVIWWKTSFAISNSSVVLRCVLKRRMSATPQ